MDPMTPVYSSGTLLIIAAVAVAVLLALIIGLKMHAFVALILVSFVTGIAAGIPLADLPAGEPTLAELSPDWLPAVTSLLAIVVLGAAIWRGRRFGPLVVERR